jgi:histidinol-phosphate aminotransferase
VKRLFGRYRQYQELPPEEVSRGLLARRDEERAREVVFVPELDLARTAWHEPPHPEAVNAATFALRRRMNAYPDPGAREVRELAAARHGVDPAQIAVGHGAAELLQEACAALLGTSASDSGDEASGRGRGDEASGRGRGDEASGRGRGGELLVAWPGWRPLPELARRAGGTPVPVERSGDEASGRGSSDIGPLADRVGADTRAVALSSPNDPTGAPVARADVRALCERVGERVWVLLDEAFADFLEPGEDAAGLVAELPNLLVFRTFAKAHAMAGFRIGYVLAPAELAERLTPSFSVNAPAQAAAAWALELGDPVVASRRAAAARERDRLGRALQGTSLSFAPSAAPFVWLSSDTYDGAAIAAHLRARRIAVAPGERWGDARHVRITLRDSAATDRLIAALREID